MPPLTHVQTGAHGKEQPKPMVEIVVLDDDFFDIEVFKRCIAAMNDSSLSLRAFQTPRAALEELKGAPCDLLFVDYHLDEGTGLDAMRLLKEAGISPPTILVTDSKSETILRDAVRGGFVDYVPKHSVIPEVMTQVIRSSLEKARMSAEIAQNQLDLADTVKRLEKSREEISLFYHSVSHELKTPLTGAREFVSLVQDGVVGDVSKEQDDLLGAAIRNCDRMVTCINDMLDASRIETGKLILNRKITDFGAVVADAVESLRGAARSKGVSLDVEVIQSAAVSAAFLDPDRSFQVVANLVSNALKFTPRDGAVHVTVQAKDDGGVRVSVCDTGVGLSEADQSRVFERLYQSRDEDAALLGGLGMGLFICREIVHLHGGSISVESKEGAGAQFSFSIPAPEADDQLKTQLAG